MQPIYDAVVRAVLLFGLMGSLLLSAAGQPVAVEAIGWIRQFGTSAWDEAYSVAVDHSGNSYVAGSTTGTLPDQTSSGGRDGFLIKYDQTGGVIWTRQFGSTADDVAHDVAVDSAGDSYVAGWTASALPGQTSSGGQDGFLIKYDQTGSVVWMRQFGSSAIDYAWRVAVDSAGNSYVVGWTAGTLPGQTSNGGQDAFVRKYDGTGTVVWTRQFGTNSGAFAYGVAVDRAGNSYVAGYTAGILPGQSSSGYWDAFVRMYDPAGSEVWTRQFGTAENDNASSVAVDGDDYLYVAGYTAGALPGQTSSGGQDAYVRKYDRTGGVIWTRQFGSTADDSAASVAVDRAGNSYVAGLTLGSLPGQTSNGGNGPDVFLRTYDRAGTAIWTRQFGSNDIDSAERVVVDNAGNSYVAGFTLGTLPGQSRSGGSGPDAFVVQFLCTKAALPPDYALPNGHFYTQAVVPGTPAGYGYAITDSGSDDRGQTIKFWSEFQRLGGVAALGYPSTDRFRLDGFWIQGTQRVLMQWRPEVQQVYLVNVFDKLNDLGVNDLLKAFRQVPLQVNDNGSCSNAGFTCITQYRQGWLDSHPKLKAFYFTSVPDPVLMYGLPTSRVDTSNAAFDIIRLQRAVLQYWKVSIPNVAYPGLITVGLGGDIAKEHGLVPRDAMAPMPPAACR